MYEDNHLLVVNKPALLPTMGVQPTDDSLYKWAGGYLKHKYNKPGNVYVGIVSRLDSHTSGLIVLARTSKAASRLSDQLRRGDVGKQYLALIPSGLVPANGELNHRLVKNEAKHRMQVLPDSAANVSGEKKAKLEYETVDRSDSIQALRIKLITGRKHQIRVQLEYAGVPILGDRKYGSDRRFPTGIALHCFQLSFLHPTLKTVQSFQAAPPPYWPSANLKKLKSLVRET